MTDRGELIVKVVDTSVALRAPVPLLAQLETLLADLEPGTEPSRHMIIEEEPDGRLRLLDEGSVVRSGIEPALAAATIVWRLNAIAAETTRHLVIHAGCVADEGAVILPGQSGAGKSTLVAACIAAGMAYLSDEYAIIDMHDGVVVPYPKPLGLRAEHVVASSDLRAGSVGAALPAGGIVFPRYEAGSQTTVTRLDPAWTLLALTAHATNLAALGGSALAWMAGLAVAYPARQITYSNADDAVGVVRAAGERSSVPLRPAETIGPITPTTTTIVLGDGLAVMHESTGKVHLLNAAASLVWTCMPDAPDASRLADVALARLPAGSLDRASVAATIRHLGRSGLLPAESS